MQKDSVDSWHWISTFLGHIMALIPFKKYNNPYPEIPQPNLPEFGHVSSAELKASTEWSVNSSSFVTSTLSFLVVKNSP